MGLIYYAPMQFSCYLAVSVSSSAIFLPLYTYLHNIPNTTSGAGGRDQEDGSTTLHPGTIGSNGGRTTAGTESLQCRHHQQSELIAIESLPGYSAGDPSHCHRLRSTLLLHASRPE